MASVSYHTYPAVVLFSYDLEQLPTKAKFFVVAAAGMLVLSLLFILLLYIHRWWMIVTDKKKADLRFTYQYFIYDTLVGKRGKEPVPSVELLINRFQQEELNTSLKKQVMIDLLVDLKKSFSGESARQFSRLYVGLGLQHFSIAKLSQKDSIIKIQGLRELSALNHGCPQLEWAINKWQFSDDQLLAHEAQIAALCADSPQMFHFLEKLREPVGEWMQIQLHHQLSVMPEQERPRLDQWLQSNNPFALRLILQLLTLIKQDAAEEKIVSLLHHQDDEVKQQALSYLLTHDVKHATGAIFHLLDTENESLQVAAVIGIGKLGNYYHAELLRPLLRRKSAALSEAALQAITSIEQRGTSMSAPAAIHKSIKLEKA